MRQGRHLRHLKAPWQQSLLCPLAGQPTRHVHAHPHRTMQTIARVRALQTPPARDAALSGAKRLDGPAPSYTAWIWGEPVRPLSSSSLNLACRMETACSLQAAPILHEQRSFHFSGACRLHCAWGSQQVMAVPHHSADRLSCAFLCRSACGAFSASCHAGEAGRQEAWRLAQGQLRRLRRAAGRELSGAHLPVMASKP